MSKFLSVASRSVLAFCLTTHMACAMEVDSEERSQNPKTITFGQLLASDQGQKIGELLPKGSRFVLRGVSKEIQGIWNERIVCLNLCYHAPWENNSLSQFTNLTELNLDSNRKITDEVVSVLTKLRKLNLRGNLNITTSALKTLLNLTELDLDGNSKIERDIFKTLTDIQTLSLRHNGLIPGESITHLPLKTLILDTQVSDRAGAFYVSNTDLSKLTTLTELSVAFNGIITPDSVSCLTNLTKLTTTRSELRLSDGFCDLSKVLLKVQKDVFRPL